MEESLETAKKATVITIFLVVTKALAGYITNSWALLADALHSFTDVVLIAAVWLGLNIAKKPPDEKFPYGYYRIENVIAFVLSIVVVVFSVFMVSEGVSRIFEAQKVTNIVFAVGVSVASILISGYVAFMELRSAEKENVESLKLNAMESFADVGSSFAVFLAIVLNGHGIYWVDGAVTVGIALLVLTVGLRSFKDSVLALMDYSPEKERKKIEEVLRNMGVKWESIKLRRVGPYLLGEIVTLHKRKDFLGNIQEKVENIKKEVGKIGNVLDVSIIPKPESPEVIKIAIPVEREGETHISSHFGHAEYFLIADVDMKEKEVLRIEYVKNKYAEAKKKRGYLAGKDLISRGVSAVILKKAGEPAVAHLKGSGIQVFRAEAESALENIQLFLKGELKEF